MTLLCTFLLSKTLWRNEPPSAFLLELPPYRVPQIGRVLVRSLLDRTLLVLRRAVCVALPAGVLIWLLANAGGGAALTALTGFFDPIGRFFGLDGVILVRVPARAAGQRADYAADADVLRQPLLADRPVLARRVPRPADRQRLDGADRGRRLPLVLVPFALRDHAADHPPRDRPHCADAPVRRAARRRRAVLLPAPCAVGLLL